MNIAVCDSNELGRSSIILFLHKYFSNKSISYEISEFKSGENLLHEFDAEKYFDLIFLDIYMNDVLGIEVAQSLRSRNYRGDIIFAAASDKFAVAGYEVGASAYLLKPHSAKKFNAALDKILKWQRPDTYNIMQRGNMICVPYNEILYVESSNSKCMLHRTNDRNYVIYKRLRDIEAELCDGRFLRCHQSYIVNMNFIMHTGKEFTLSTGDVILIRQRDLNEIKQRCFDYLEKTGGSGAC